MSECVQNCRLCNKFILSQSIVFNSTVNQLIVDLPAGSYGNCQKYCIVLAQSIPTDTTLNAQVVFTIGGDATVGYPFLNKDCTPIYASQVRTRRLYPTRVNTAVNTGVFKYIGNNCLPSTGITVGTSIPVATTATLNNIVEGPAVMNARKNTPSNPK